MRYNRLIQISIALGLLATQSLSCWAAKPAFAAVAAAPIAIEPQPFPGAPERADQNDILKKLSDEATQRMRKTLLARPMAGRVLAADGAAQGVPLLTGFVRLPISLPRNMIGLQAFSQRGTLAVAGVTLRSADGTMLAEGKAALKWGDGRWTEGGRIRRNRPLDAVLEHFVRKAVDQAVRQMSDTVASSRRDALLTVTHAKSMRFEQTLKRRY